MAERGHGRGARPRGSALAARGLAGASHPAEGLALWQACSRATATQVLAVSLDRGSWSGSYPPRLRWLLLPSLRDEQPGLARAPEPASAARGCLAAPAERRRLLEAQVREQVGQVLRVGAEPRRAGAPLKSLGLDSLIDARAAQRLEAAFGLALSATLALELPHDRRAGRTSPRSSARPA